MTNEEIRKHAEALGRGLEVTLVFAKGLPCAPEFLSKIERAMRDLALQAYEEAARTVEALDGPLGADDKASGALEMAASDVRALKDSLSSVPA